MKHFGLLLLTIILSSCLSIRHIGFEISNYNKLKTANLITENEKNVSYISQLNIVDYGVFEALDSIIYLTTECKNYSPKMKYLFSFVILADYDNKNITYTVFTELSVKNAIENNQVLEGGFYYKNYLFIVNSGIRSEIDKSNLFYRKTDCKLKIYPWDFQIDKCYYPVANIEIENGRYHIESESLCKKEVPPLNP